MTLADLMVVLEMLCSGDGHWISTGTAVWVVRGFGLTVSLVGRAMCGRDRGRVQIFLERFRWPIASRLPIFKERFLFSSKTVKQKGGGEWCLWSGMCIRCGFLIFCVLLLLCYAATLFV
jgi:hypothetical protein